MKINYIYQNPDNKNRAECLLRALFEAENININEFKGENVISVSCDGSAAFYSFDSDLSRNGNLGWRLCAKSAGECFLGYKPDVRIVAEKAENYYNQPSGIHLFPRNDKPNDIFVHSENRNYSHLLKGDPDYEQ